MADFVVGIIIGAIVGLVAGVMLMRPAESVPPVRKRVVSAEREGLRAQVRRVK